VPDGFGPGAVPGELDHPVHETNPFRRRQAIGLKEQPDLLAVAGGPRRGGGRRGGGRPAAGGRPTRSAISSS
jgi:hypothetical protein